MTTDELARFSVQQWLETAAQGYLLGREHGHLAGEREPEWLLASEPLRMRATRVTVQLLAAERCSLAASAGLLRLAPGEQASRHLATQVVDEARHAEIFSQRLLDLGVPPERVEETVAEHTSPNLERFARLLHDTVERRDFVGALVGHNVLLEGVTLSILDLLHRAQREQNPKFANMLSGTVADERRHAVFGEALLAARLRRDPELRARTERVQGELAHGLLAAFGDLAREAALEPPAMIGGSRRGREEMLAFLTHGVEEDIRMRFARIGLAYQAPDRS